MSWGEDARTDRAIELLRTWAAKTDAEGNVVPAHRYTRSLRAAGDMALAQVAMGSIDAFTIRREVGEGCRGVVCEIEGADGDWTQTGEAWSSEGLYDTAAMAICRALLHYIKDDNELMSEEAVIAMLESFRKE